MAEKPFEPYISPSRTIPEFTLQALALGLVLAVVMAAANLYLGLYAGTTVAASIPAAVMSMGILRGVFRRGTILENNIVQTMAASGESMAGGMLFTVPAFLIAGIWLQVDYWITTLICLSGGILGIVAMIPLRRVHVVEDRTLLYPEGVACAEVLKAGESGDAQAKFVFGALGISAVVKLLTTGLGVFKPSLEWAFPAGRTAFYVGADVSPALLAVGYIVGFDLSFVIALGGLLAWGVAIPIIGLAHGVQGSTVDWYWDVWSNQVRYLGVGAMMVGGVASIWEVRKSAVSAISEMALGLRTTKPGESARTDRNLPVSAMAALILFASALMFVLYHRLLGSVGAALVVTLIAVSLCFPFVAVASYIVGMVGSSNSPVSGMTISAVLLTGGLLWIGGIGGPAAVAATLGIAGVVCCAVCGSGEMAQDLKTGYLIGATPKQQQWAQIIGVVAACLVLAPVLTILNDSYGIGTGQPGSLKAPQAALFANIAKALFGQGTLPWDFVAMGGVLGAVFLAIDAWLAKTKSSFRMPVMAAAVGLYLPLTISVTTLLGGIVQRFCRNKGGAGVGVLFSSGLVAGESITGIVLGGVLYFNMAHLPITLVDSSLLSVLALGGLVGLLWRVGAR